MAPADALRMVAAEARAAIQSTALPTARLAAVGAVLPGLTDFHTGVCLLAPNLGWRDVPVRDILAPSSAPPSTCTTPARPPPSPRTWRAPAGGSGTWRCCTRAPASPRASCPTAGSSTVSAGPRARSGTTRVPGNDEPCNCGKVGCLETIASGPAIVRAVRRALAAGEASSLAGSGVRRAGRHRGRPGPATRLPTAAIAEVGAHLGLAASWLINAYNPAVVIVGGGLAPIGDLLLDPLRAAVARHALAPALRGVEIRASMLGPDAEVRGAVLLALQHSETYYRVVFRA